MGTGHSWVEIETRILIRETSGWVKGASTGQNLRMYPNVFVGFRFSGLNCHPYLGTRLVLELLIMIDTSDSVVTLLNFRTKF